MIEEDTLYQLYWEKEMSSREVGDELGCSKKKVLDWMDRHGVKKRKSSHQKSNKDNVDEGELESLYKEEDWSLRMLGEKYGVGHHTIRRILESRGIEIHSRGDGISRAYKHGRRKRIRMFGEDNPFYDKRHDEETLKEMRLRRIEKIRKRSKNGNQIHPNYNPQACELIEEYGEKHGYDFQHAENGGEYYIEELGYWVDGYDKKANVVVEVDEPQHYRNGELCEKDKRRQREIVETLNCEFIRLKI